MLYRVAVASTDGLVVNQHFGKADQFLILEVLEDKSFRYVETRKVVPVCQGGVHDDRSILENAKVIGDCKYLLVSRIGYLAEGVLEQQGIAAYCIADVIEQAVNKLIGYIDMNEYIYGLKE